MVPAGPALAATWSVVTTPAGTSLFFGVDATSTTNAWAVGQYFASSQPFLRTLVHRFDGTSWSIVPSPNPDSAKNLLSDVDGSSANDVWAIGNMGDDGYGGTAVGLVERWNGQSWQRSIMTRAPNSRVQQCRRHLEQPG